MVLSGGGRRRRRRAARAAPPPARRRRVANMLPSSVFSAVSCLVAVVVAPTVSLPSHAGTDVTTKKAAPSLPAKPNIPRWATTYDWNMAGDISGSQAYTNLAFSTGLDKLDWAWGNHSIQGLWDFNGCKGGCIPNKTGVIGEPYCGGKTGLMAGWQVGVQWVVEQIKARAHVVGLSLGDEPEIQGVPYSQMCELSMYLKQTLIAANRSDVFIHCASTHRPDCQQHARDTVSGARR
jgi:hypothetical protein